MNERLRADAVNAAAFEAFLRKEGYRQLRRIGGVFCGVRRFNFTFGIVVGLAWEGYERRYCYEYEQDALAELGVWDGEAHPCGPWIKCKGAGIDLLNPELRV
ncbi:hypothetical protein DelCs14_1795 [Delftia sp. Cs1-4]|uniref:hypothetical protein n=1 Tax=Delftia sp. (strain Cs1-4) TaxID=742013 RepID=UPI00020E7BE5|nr:hypothetical protein [Delftia sp. Cs1-4]AEF88820.1 hypothetical protein DelCs14_1795 [Delftia sp. Cs1-4]